jgi:hypothetical protein
LSGSSGWASQCSWRAPAVAADFDLHQVLGQQQVEAVLAQHQLAQQLMGHAVRVLGQRRQGFALARRAGDARVIEARAGGDGQKRSWRASASSPWRSSTGSAQLRVSPRLCW